MGVGQPPTDHGWVGMFKLRRGWTSLARFHPLEAARVWFRSEEAAEGRCL